MKLTLRNAGILSIAFVGSVLFHALVFFAIDFRFEIRGSVSRVLNVQLVPQTSTPSVLPEQPGQALEHAPIYTQPNSSDTNAKPIGDQPNQQDVTNIDESREDSQLPESPMFSVDAPDQSIPTSRGPAVSIRDLVHAATLIAREQSAEQHVRNIEGDDTANTEEEYYLKSWLKKVQEVGQLNYPQKAIAQSLYGKLRLYVAIKPDGSVKETRVIRSSGHEVLDEAAQHIVKLASPFSPFPKSMRETLGLLEIIREWEFRKEAFITTTDAEEDKDE